MGWRSSPASTVACSISERQAYLQRNPFIHPFNQSINQSTRCKQRGLYFDALAIRQSTNQPNANSTNNHPKTYSVNQSIHLAFSIKHIAQQKHGNKPGKWRDEFWPGRTPHRSRRRQRLGVCCCPLNSRNSATVHTRWKASLKRKK